MRSIIGLNQDAHLRAVIGGDASTLDAAKAARETVDTVRAQTTNSLRTLLLECTNLPPYKGALAAAFDVQIIDILTEIEAVRPKSIRPAFPLAGGGYQNFDGEPWRANFASPQARAGA